jgi:two-component system, sensor histidine kinase
MKTKGSVLWMVRLLLFSRIVIVLLALGFALIIWQKNTRSLVQSVEKLSTENPNVDMLERGITLLYQAENNFRFYSATYDRTYFDDYTHDLYSVSNIIDSLQSSLNNSENIDNIGLSLTKKADISNVVIRLKMLTDSLLSVAGQWDTSATHKPQLPVFDIRKIQNLQKKSSVDSIFDTGTVKKKGFFKKVKSLFADDSTPKKKGITVKRSEVTNDTTIETNIKSTPEYALLQDIHSYYSDKINSYTDGRSRLNQNEKALATINANLINEIVNILRQVKQSEMERTKVIKEDASKTGEKSARSISAIAALSVLIAAIFFFLIIYYLGKIKESAAKLEKEKQNAENLALQKSQFLSGMSHEIRAPLNNILGFTEQLKKSHDENHDKFMEGISSSAEMMLSTVNQILDFSKLEAGKMQFNSGTFSPYKAIEAAAGTMVLRAREKKLMLNLHLPLKEDILVSGDEFRLKQVIVNLLDNAIKYTEKGEINVTAKIKPDGEGFKAVIEVEDTGIGVPPDKVEAIFNEFERLEENENRRWKTGTGLGLPIAKRVIEQQHGKIYIKSTSDKGTIFAIELLYSKPTKAMNQSSGNVSGSEIPSGKTILLADDDSLSILLISSICKKYDIKIISASNGQVAYEMAMKQKVDLILTDINMPVLSGPDFVRKLRATPEISAIPVVAITANVLNEDIKCIDSAGFSGIIFKPFRENDLIKKISFFLK